MEAGRRFAKGQSDRDFRTPNYGLRNNLGDLFTPRQLVALTTFSDLVQETREQVRRDALAASVPDDGKALRDGGAGATAYAEAVGVYLAFAVDRIAMTGNNLVRWNAVGQKAQHCFGRQALPMVWDYAEPNCLAFRQPGVSMLLFYTPARPLNWLPSLDSRWLLSTGCYDTNRSHSSTVSPPTRLITTTSATLICPISSMSGYAVP